MQRVVLLVLGAVLIVLVGIVGGVAWLLRQVPLQPVLLVQHADGNLALVDANGNHRSLTSDANGKTRVYDFPVPAPDGHSVAYVLTEGSFENHRSSLIMHELDGEQRTLFESTEIAPFYLYWSPDSNQLAFLGGSTDGMLLQNVNTHGKPVVKHVTRGEPSYFSWRPDSGQLLLHTRGAAPRGTLAVWGLEDTEPRLLEAAPALFNAPAWLDDDRSVVVLRDERGATLARLDAHGAVEQRLAVDGTGMFFGIAPNGKAIAYTPLQQAAIGPLHIVGMDGTGDRNVSSAPAYAFMWSPDSSRLAYLSVAVDAETRPAAFRRQSDLRLTWYVVDVATGRSRALHTFAPSRAFLNLLPYFDQYAQSLRLWDKHGKRLVFADTAGVWTLDVATGDVTKIDDGVLGMWIER